MAFYLTGYYVTRDSEDTQVAIFYLNSYRDLDAWQNNTGNTIKVTQIPNSTMDIKQAIAGQSYRVNLTNRDGATDNYYMITDSWSEVSGMIDQRIRKGDTFNSTIRQTSEFFDLTN